MFELLTDTPDMIMKAMEFGPEDPGCQVTRSMVYARTTALASIAGRPSHAIRQSDYERAKRELTGESDFNRQEEILDRMDYR